METCLRSRTRVCVGCFQVRESCSCARHRGSTIRRNRLLMLERVDVTERHPCRRRARGARCESERTCRERETKCECGKGRESCAAVLCNNPLNRSKPGVRGLGLRHARMLSTRESVAIREISPSALGLTALTRREAKARTRWMSRVVHSFPNCPKIRPVKSANRRLARNSAQVIRARRKGYLIRSWPPKADIPACESSSIL